ncbi:hypothetical protein CEXT_169401 [Caerostris extrusa]|uniref:Uncharacterized protein n=1 Tax=Caerostris extrusa TaxID=172846 RepID=A0AAV4T3G3_CAEEX|nr:hypothetical protein CEXT_169401 [Caerostris extrusa]
MIFEKLGYSTGLLIKSFITVLTDLTLAVNKGQMSQPVSSRLLCCKMLGKICLKFDAYVIKKRSLASCTLSLSRC